MKLFENITEYHAFKRKYEMMGQLEEERLMEAANNPESLKSFLEFMDEVLSFPVDPKAKAMTQEEELQAEIDRQKFFTKIPHPFYDPS